MEQKVIKMAFLNSAMTSFCYALVGMSIYLILGIKNYIIYISVLNILTMISNFFSGYLQNKFSNMNNAIKVLQVSIIFECLYTIFHIISDVSIINSVNIFLIFQIMAIIMTCGCFAFYNIYRERILSCIYKNDYVQRSKFNSNIRMIGSTASMIGHGLNFILVFIFENVFIVEKIKFLYIIVLIHVFFVLCDFIITIIERNTVIKYFKNLEES